jgi:hypothetical protein
MRIQGMEIANGIEGIRKYLSENKSGWQVFINDAYVEYSEDTLTYIIKKWSAEDYRLICIAGNTLHFVDTRLTSHEYREWISN